MPLVVGTGLLTATLIALLQRSYSRRITVLREDLKSRDDRLDELEKKLYLFKVNELQAKVANLKPQPRRRLTNKKPCWQSTQGCLRADSSPSKSFTTWQALIAAPMAMIF
jgi:hypothetical protein